ncbi:MAG: hypothetical protein WC656_12065 [Sulfurimonas sp.]|jgi:hypothetical protein
MDFTIATWMMLFFILFMIVGMWKVYAFLPNKKLADDDTTKESQEELMRLMLKTIQNSDEKLTQEDLFRKIKEDEDFDKKHFWRFNQNRLNQLLELYFLQNPHVPERSDKCPWGTKNIEDIHKNSRA